LWGRGLKPGPNEQDKKMGGGERRINGAKFFGSLWDAGRKGKTAKSGG